MEENLEHWEEKIRNNFENSNFSKKTLKTKERKLFVMYVILTVLIFLLSISTMIILIIVAAPYSKAALSCAIALPIVFMFCGMLFSLIKASKKHKLWWKKMCQLLGFEEYYQLAINQFTNGEIRLVDISEKFSVAPWWPLNKKKFSYLNNDKILNMVYDDKVVISFGTVMISKWIGKYQVNYSQPYLACELLHKKLNMDATIKKSDIFNQITDNTDLESTVFEKMYYVKSNDQIEIRKLLTPKVIENLISTAKICNIPEMIFKDKYLVFSFEKQRLNLMNKCDSKLVCFNFKKNPEYWATQLINLINHDLNLLLNALRWFICFDQFTK